MRLVFTIVVANVLVSLADWFFFGILWHDKYKAYPEVWRRPAGGHGETAAVAVSAVVGALTPTVFILVCVLLGQVRLQNALVLGGGVWLMSAVPMWLWNFVFMKVHPLVLLSGMLGWLVRLALAALTVGLLLG
jgi:hypothetical protein